MTDKVQAGVTAERQRAHAIIAFGQRLGTSVAAITEAISSGVSAAEFELETLARRIASA